jgi:hypothetical protein
VDAVRRLVPALAAALACTACTSPIFEPDVAGLQDIIRTYEVIRPVGTTLAGGVPDTDRDGNLDFDVHEDRFVFLPHKDANRLNFTKGFMIRERIYDNENEIYFRWDDAGTVKWMRTPAGYHDDDGVPWMWPVTLKNNTSLAAVVFQGDEDQTYLERILADPSSGQCSFSPPPHWYVLGEAIKPVLGLIDPPTVVGISVNADPLPGQDYLYALVREGGNWWEVNAQLADTGLMGAMNNNPPGNYPLPFLGTPRHIAYFRDQLNQRSFAQWRDWDGRWITWVWHGPPSPPDEIEELPDIGHPIVAVVSHLLGPTLLLSVEEQVARIYEYAGFGSPPVLAAEFPLGQLRFIGEMRTTFDEVTWGWWLLFSRTTLSGDQVGFEVRGILTDDALDTFGN